MTHEPHALVSGTCSTKLKLKHVLHELIRGDPRTHALVSETCSTKLKLKHVLRELIRGDSRTWRGRHEKEISLDKESYEEKELSKRRLTH